MSEMCERRMTDPAAVPPFDHLHSDQSVEMKLVSTAEVPRDGWIRRVLTFACPTCGYELAESTPERAMDLASA